MIHRISLLILITFIGVAVQAKDTIVGGISSKSISINTTFTGSDILVFGSIKRASIDKIISSDIIIEVLGPRTNITVRKKQKIFGIWVSRNPVRISNTPSFYSILYTKDPEKILGEIEQKNKKIGKKQFFKSKNLDPNYIESVNAKIRIKSKEGAYIFNADPINLKDETLFSANISLPANLTEGDYEIKTHLVQNGKVVNSSKDIIEVRKIGLEKWLYKTAHQQPLFYGFFSICLAIFSGWGASSLFRRFQK